IVLRVRPRVLRLETRQPSVGDNRARADGDTVEKVASRNRAAHAEIPIANRLAVVVVCHMFRHDDATMGHVLLDSNGSSTLALVMTLRLPLIPILSKDRVGIEQKVRR